MAFLNFTLLIGAVLVGVPIALHLAMRQQPKRVLFPAIRFVKERRETNRRKLRLRQWLLLLLRCLAILIPVLALARPTAASTAMGTWSVIAVTGGLALLTAAMAATSLVTGRSQWLTGGLAAVAAIFLVATLGLFVRALRDGSDVALGNQQAPVAAVMVFDTSPRMLYRQSNETRLQQARDTALWVLRQLPADSSVAVIDARPGATGFSVDLGAAKRSIERLQVTGLADPLDRVLQRALDLAAESTISRQEIYLFSDLTQPAWTDIDPNLAKRLDEQPDTLLYVVDVGVANPKNLAVQRLDLSDQRLSRGGQLRLEAEVASQGLADQCTLEMYVEEPDSTRPVLRDGQLLAPEPRLRGQRTCELVEGGAQTVEFEVGGLPKGTHQGFVQLVGRDGLEVDDRRYFAIEVADAWPLLVVAPPGVDTDSFVEAVAPYEQRKTGQARFEVTRAAASELANRSLDEFQVVCLIDPPPLTPIAWQQLSRFVGAGGGLALFLGYQASENVGSFNVEQAQQLMPGELTRQWRTGGRDIYLAPVRYDHPVLAEFREIATQVPWNRFPIYRHWGMDLRDDTQVVLRFGNGQPAILEATHQQGRILTMTTPITELERPGGRRRWNELAGPNDWPRFVLVNEMMLHLVDSGQQRLNYLTGDTAAITNREREDPERYQLFAPPDETREVAARDGRLMIRGTEHPGAYRLKGNRGGVVVRGFAVNYPAEVGDLTRIDPEQLDQALGKDRYQLARERDEIEVGVGRARVGYEFYPFLLLVVAVVLALESVLANRFYRKE